MDFNGMLLPKNIYLSKEFVQVLSEKNHEAWVPYYQAPD
jgi:hypothetical protein